MKLNKTEATSIKIRCYIDIIFGVMAAFILLGALSGKQLALIWGIIFIIGWGMSQAIRNAFSAFQLLRSVNSTSTED